MKRNIPSYILIAQIIVLTSCKSHAQKDAKEYQNNFNQKFSDYWYQGKAELTTYELKQARYGEERDGEATLVFVTEDFLVDKQVKKESNSSNKATSVLKLNFIRKFPTGIYDYSMLTSTFSPIHQKKLVYPIKSTTSSQEWCGHSWLQYNLMNEKYRHQSFSYFESEGDQKKVHKKEMLEDGIWAQIRMNAELIPLGEVQLIPSSHYLRFAHQEIKSYKAMIHKGEYQLGDMGDKNLRVISINYPTLERTLEIIYEPSFPFKIVGWKETRNSWGKEMTTIAKIKGQLNSPYWSQNKNADTHLRDSLLLK